ncbi:HAUS augmin-like complex subunit 8 [Sorex fumeus]|uniref:HAUS augmin-like complex subunit 8 n=1 Tax=Sorex fumeus TaxID=62283 RepID=UPI0024ACF7C8|nr:HAUS augmin-like complex subunit 8 [Sorex fumeus]
MAESSGRGAGKPSSGDPSTTGGTRRKTAGGRVVASRYLQPKEKAAARKAPEADAVKTSGKMPERGRRPVPGRSSNSSRDASKADKGDLQSTLLEGHGPAPPDLDISAINSMSAPSSGNGGGRGTRPQHLSRPDESTSRRARQPERRACGKLKSSVCTAPKSRPTLSEVMEMVDSQALLLTLLSVKMENGLAAFEEEAEKKLLAAGREEERLRKTVHEQRRQLLLGQRRRQLAAVLDLQIAMLSPCEAILQRFKEQYQALASALDTTRHELPVSDIHLDQDRAQFLDDVQRELLTTRQLLGELGLDSTADPRQILTQLQELKTSAQATDLELQRSFEQLLELSAEASKEVALGNQEVWEEAQGKEESLMEYFSLEAATPTKKPAS